MQNIEFDALAPDSMEEALNARHLLAVWVAKAWLKSEGKSVEGLDNQELEKIGDRLMTQNPDIVDSLDIYGENIEKGHRKVRILKARKSYNAYGDMITFYAVKNLMMYMESHPDVTITDIAGMMNGERISDWVNLGGQLMPESVTARPLKASRRTAPRSCS